MKLCFTDTVHIFLPWLLSGCCLCVQNPCVFSCLLFSLFSSICVFLVTLLCSLLQGQGESAAAVLCPVGDSDPAPALCSLSCPLHLGPGSTPCMPLPLQRVQETLQIGWHISVSRPRRELDVILRIAAAVEWSKSRTQLSNFEQQEEEQGCARGGKCTLCLDVSLHVCPN